MNTYNNDCELMPDVLCPKANNYSVNWKISIKNKNETMLIIIIIITKNHE